MPNVTLTAAEADAILTLLAGLEPGDEPARTAITKLGNTTAGAATETRDGDTVTWTGELPVPAGIVDRWLDDGVTWARISFPTSLADAIWAEDMETWNEMCDAIIGRSLTDLTYGIDWANSDPGSDDGTFTAWVHGDLRDSI